MSLRDRILKRLNALGLKPARASVDAKLGKTYVRDLLEGRVRNPRIEHLARLAVVLQTTPLWLAEGRGPEIQTVDAAEFEELQAVWETIAAEERALALRTLRSFARDAKSVTPRKPGKRKES